MALLVHLLRSITHSTAVEEGRRMYISAPLRNYGNFLNSGLLQRRITLFTLLTFHFLKTNYSHSNTLFWLPYIAFSDHIITSVITVKVEM